MALPVRYPTPWQRKTMWASLTALFVVLLVVTAASVIWVSANVISFLQPILIPVAIAAILAYLLDPVVTRMCTGGMNRTRAVLLLFVLVFVALIALGSWLVPMISMQSTNFAKDLPRYTETARDRVVDVIYRFNRTFGGLPSAKGKSGATASRLVNWLFPSPTPHPAKPSPSPSSEPVASAGANASPSPVEVIAPAPPPNKLSTADRQRIQDFVQKQIPSLEKTFPVFLDKLWALTKKSIGGFLGITGFLLSMVMVPIYLFFFLKERPRIQARWKEYLPLRASPLRDEVAEVLSQINSYVVAYFRGQFLVCLVDGMLIGSALTLIGLSFAPLIGIFVAVLTMIPYVGITLCWIPAVLIAAFQWGDWWHPILVTIIFLGIQNLEGMFYAPRIIGTSVGLHPMTVIVSIFLWGLLIGGLLGPLLAVPLTATIKVLLARYVWGKRLREQVMQAVEPAPIIKESETVNAGTLPSGDLHSSPTKA